MYYDYILSVNGKAEKHGHDYKQDYLTDVIVSFTYYVCRLQLDCSIFVTNCIFLHFVIFIGNTITLRYDFGVSQFTVIVAIS